jgi:hypothetical protein
MSSICLLRAGPPREILQGGTRLLWGKNGLIATHPFHNKHSSLYSMELTLKFQKKEMLFIFPYPKKKLKKLMTLTLLTSQLS